ncbi:hypothetical protein [Polaromonas sp.]|uniref:hypothetical protein n=1 Tax=Polaromonas sp. TaxID=1869339 RepID=UPI0025EC3D95|nr:hypothetical protein [Polaromonas sp.]
MALLFGQQALAAWLQICPAGDDAASSRYEVQMLRPDGSELRASISDTLPSPRCENKVLELSAQDVVGLRPITPAQAAQPGSPFALSGKTQDSRFLITEIIAAETSSAPAPATLPLPLGHNLLNQLNAATFGAENRVNARLQQGRLSMQCSPGGQPAGVVLSAPSSYLPRARSQLQIRGNGNGSFEIVAVSAAQAARDAGSHLGYFEARPSDLTQAYALDKVAARSDWRHWTIACPAGSAQLQLDSLLLLPQATTVPSRAAWVWQAAQWQQKPEAVLALARKYALGTLYITVPVAAGAVHQPDRLAAFIRRAGAAGIAVWAVDGDPNMVQLKERPATLARARAYSRFNSAMPPGARLRGVQFDVEPYLLAGYEMAAAAWDQRYVELVKSLHDNSDMALEMVVPFWWAGKPALLDSIAPWLSGLVVMDYRTDPEEIYRFAATFLDWGDRHGKSVRVALEAGPIALETRYRYEPAAAGELWQVLLGKQYFLLVLRRPMENPHGIALRALGTHNITGSATSFYGDTASLLRQLPELESVFSAWPSFAGMALHEIK